MSLMLRSAQGRAGVVMPGRAQGDPGLFGFLKGAAKVGVATLTGGPGAGIASAASQLSAARGGVTVAPMTLTSRQAAPPAPSRFTVTPSAIAPGGERFVTRAPAAAGMQLACPSGHHPNKSDYYLRDGTFVPKGSRCVKNRRRDPLNPKALRRSISRINGAKTWQSALSEIETSKYRKSGSKKD